MATPPPLPPPTYDIRESRAPSLYAATIVTYVLAVVAVACRFWARRLLKARILADDWFAVLALLFATGLFVSTIVWLHQGYGRHFEVLDRNTFVPTFFKNLFTGEIIYTLVIVTVKFSILAFYWRLFTQAIRLPVYILGAITSAWGLAVILVTIFQCKPVSGFWNRTPSVQCKINDHAFFIGIAVPNIVTDGAILSLPIPFIRKLHRDGPQKVALIGMFMLGGFVTIISIVRLATLISVDLKSPDIDWNFAPVGIWTLTEANIAIVCACLPSLRPLLSLLLTGSASPSGYGSSGASKQSSFRHVFKRSQPSSSGGSYDSEGQFVPLEGDSIGLEGQKQSYSTVISGVKTVEENDYNVRQDEVGPENRADNGISVRSDVNVNWSK